MRMGQKKGKTDALMVLLLFGVFAVCILSVLLTGAEAYRRLALRDRTTYDRRTAAQYLTTRVRQADQLDGVDVREFGGADALVLLEEIEGTMYQTLVYCYDGYLRELFTAADTGFSPEAGEKILQAQALSLHREGRQLTVRLTGPTGEVQEWTLYLRSGEEGAA